MAAYFIHQSSYVDANVTIGENTKIWHFSHIQSGAMIGRDCVLGQNVNIGPNVQIGNGVKIQNNVSIYEGVILEDSVFCGPSCVFTNDHFPRARYPKNTKEYEVTRVCEGCTIGANATIVCGNKIGAWALIGAGAVVTKDVLSHALVIGNPARQVGWVCECGERLEESFVCPCCGRRYVQTREGLSESKIS